MGTLEAQPLSLLDTTTLHASLPALPAHLQVLCVVEVEGAGQLVRRDEGCPLLPVPAHFVGAVAILGPRRRLSEDSQGVLVAGPDVSLGGAALFIGQVDDAVFLGGCEAPDEAELRLQVRVLELQAHGVGGRHSSNRWKYEDDPLKHSQSRTSGYPKTPAETQTPDSEHDPSQRG